MKRTLRLLIVVATLTVLNTAAFAGKPLKVFILAGQSNMQGKAQVRTIERLKLTDDSKQMYNDMNVQDGKPSAVKDVYGVYFSGGDMKKGTERPGTELKGPLKPGFDSEMTETTTFGPEYTFGIYMQKHLNEPILIIKTAWGGRDLQQQFRPPSAGKFEKDKDGHGNPIGHYYNLIIKRTNEVLADPGKYHPAYNKDDGYEIAGFVWFQGFNDKIKGAETYPEYSRLMACFIRDVRKDLKAPQLPFIIGVMGIGGVNKEDAFRKAQAAPAALPEFKDNVAAVWTGQYWDMELVKTQKKLDDAARKEVLAKKPELAKKNRALKKAIGKERKAVTAKALTPEEQAFLKVATSNAAYHYMGSAYTYGNIGKAFADAMAELMK